MKTRARRWIGTVLVQLALAIAAVELLAALVYPWIAGRPYSRARLRQALAARRSALPDLPLDTVRTEEPTFIGGHILHPYAGFVNDPAKDPNVNVLGFWGPSPLLKKDPSRVNIAIVGGSVALQLYRVARQTLIAELKRSPQFAGKEIAVVCLAVSGYKQPQQLLALSFLVYLGAEYDIVINLDGFNEVVLPLSDNLPNRVFPYYPRIWNFYAQKGLTPAVMSQMATVMRLEQDREALSATFSRLPLRLSNLGLVVWEQLDRRAERRIQEAYLRLVDTARTGGGEAAFGPVPDYENDWHRYFGDNAGRWEQASLQMHHLGESSGFRYHHFLQPNQYVEGSKTFSEEEKRIADIDAYAGRSFPFHPSMRNYKWAARNGYPHLIAAGKNLQARGVRFTDLTRMFVDVRETIYDDACCHLNQRGYDMLATEIAREIAGGGEPRPTPP